MIVLVDMDGVLVDYNLEVHDRLKKKFGEIKINEQKFYIKERYDQKYHAEIDKICNRKNFFGELHPLVGAVDALQQMLKSGHDVFICSSFFTEYLDSINGKVNWVMKNLGKEWLKRLILTKDKTIVQGDILIDDKPEIKGVTKPTWKIVIFDKPYNQDLLGARLKDWKKWKTVFN